MVKSECFIFSRKFHKIQTTATTFHKICSLDFSKMLCDSSRSNWRKNNLFLIFQDNVDCAQRTPLLYVLGAKLTCFIFIVSLLFFLIVLSLELGAIVMFYLLNKKYQKLGINSQFSWREFNISTASHCQCKSILW